MGHSRPDPLARPAGSPRRPTVLIVDDQASMRDTLEVLLRTHGYRILQSASGAEALETVRRHRVDVVLLDLHLGDGIDGFAVLGQLRCRFPEVEVIVCSGDRSIRQAVR